MVAERQRRGVRVINCQEKIGGGKKEKRNSGRCEYHKRFPLSFCGFQHNFPILLPVLSPGEISIMPGFFGFHFAVEIARAGHAVPMARCRRDRRLFDQMPRSGGRSHATVNSGPSGAVADAAAGQAVGAPKALVEKPDRSAKILPSTGLENFPRSAAALRYTRAELARFLHPEIPAGAPLYQYWPGSAMPDARRDAVSPATNSRRDCG